MLDRYSIKVIKKPLHCAAVGLDRKGISANQVTVCGFLLGALAFPSLLLHQFERDQRVEKKIEADVQKSTGIGNTLDSGYCTIQTITDSI